MAVCSFFSAVVFVVSWLIVSCSFALSCWRSAAVAFWPVLSWVLAGGVEFESPFGFPLLNACNTSGVQANIRGVPSEVCMIGVPLRVEVSLVTSSITASFTIIIGISRRVRRGFKSLSMNCREEVRLPVPEMGEVEVEVVIGEHRLAESPIYAYAIRQELSDA